MSEVKTITVKDLKEYIGSLPEAISNLPLIYCEIYGNSKICIDDMNLLSMSSEQLKDYNIENLKLIELV